LGHDRKLHCNAEVLAAVGLVAQRVGLIAGRTVHMMVEACARSVNGNVGAQAGGGLEPVVEVMPGRTTALLIKMKGISADVALGRRGRMRERSIYFSSR
jgi:hypothetical protein